MSLVSQSGTVTTEQPPLSRADFDREASRLTHFLDQLEERLGFVLAYTEPSDGAVPVNPARSQFHDRILYFESLNDRIQSLLNRIDI